MSKLLKKVSSNFIGDLDLKISKPEFLSKIEKMLEEESIVVKGITTKIRDEILDFYSFIILYF